MTDATPAPGRMRPRHESSAMLATKNLIAFAPISDPVTARNFYEQILGLAFRADEPHALVFDAHGMMLRLARMPEVHPAPYTILGWEVDDIDAVADELAARGVTFIRYPHFEHDERGVVAFPNADRVAWFQDPDANVLSLTQLAATG